MHESISRLVKPTRPSEVYCNDHQEEADVVYEILRRHNTEFYPLADISADTHCLRCASSQTMDEI